MRSRQRERGMALALAIFALVVVGGLIAAAFLAGHLEQRTGRSTLYAAQAADAAEAGAVRALEQWNVLGLGSLAPGASLTLPRVPFAGRTAYRITASRLNEQLFLVKSLGTTANAGGGMMARRTVAIMARLASLGAGPEAALTVAAPVEITGGDVVVSGKDDCAPGIEQPGTRVVAPSSELLTRFGDVTFDRLKARAGVVLSDTLPGSRVMRGALSATRQSVIYANGPRLELASGVKGQGILLVEGDLDITGDFDFTGLIVARGRVRISGGRTRIVGALVAGAPSGKNTIAGMVSIEYSSCALRQALAAAAFAEPLGQRSWIQVY